jgi:hypothetical protein
MLKPPVYTPKAPMVLLDYDGALHHENVCVGPHGHFTLYAPERYCMFQHVALLERLLQPFPSVQIVLATRWLQRKPLRKAAKELSPTLRARVVDGFVPPEPPSDFWAWPKGMQVAHYIEGRRPVAWFAIDDDQVGWPDWARPHVVFSDPYEGISPPEVQAAIREQLQRLAGAASK